MSYTNTCNAIHMIHSGSRTVQYLDDLDAPLEHRLPHTMADTVLSLKRHLFLCKHDTHRLSLGGAVNNSSFSSGGYRSNFPKDPLIDWSTPHSCVLDRQTDVLFNGIIGNFLDKSWRACYGRSVEFLGLFENI